jgi:bisphosphoglycerate-dependent phosphoglycerate mutase
MKILTGVKNWTGVTASWPERMEFAKRFTGWTDVSLTEKGVEEAHQAESGCFIRDFCLILCFHFGADPGNKTMWIVWMEMDLMWIPTYVIGD